MFQIQPVLGVQPGFSQCESIHGREDGSDLVPSDRVRALLLIFGPLGVSPLALARLGASADRSLTACAVRALGASFDNCGTLSKLRGEDTPQSGQSHGSAKRLMGADSSKVPQIWQVYS